MATVPKAVPATAAPNTATARLGLATRVSSGAGSQNVEELQTAPGVQFDSVAFGFRDEGRPTFDRNTGRGRHHHHPGILNASTQTFTAILEAAGTVSGTDTQSGEVRGQQSPGVISRAIKTYETNALIIAGDINILGTSVSVVL